MTKFKTFTSKYDYHPNGQKDLFHASHYLNKWLAEHPEYEIISWQAVPSTPSDLMSIVVAYKKKELHFAEIGYGY
jgi:hypothetical protein